MRIEQLDVEQGPSPVADRPARRIVVAATFTAEPVQDVLEFWMGELSLPALVEFAPYNQVFQQMLDPGSLLSRNVQGVNVVLVRLEDWLRVRSGSAVHRDLEAYLERNAADLIVAIRALSSRSTSPLIFGLCPNSAAIQGEHHTYALLNRIEERIAAELADVSGLYLLRPDDFGLYRVVDYDDPRRDQLGHVPYTPLFFAALGTIVARKAYAVLSPPHKVIVLDCDNTLWKGVVGEEGVAGIAIPPVWMELQRFMVNLASNGFLLCLCSKNDEPDVLEVFDRRTDMVLKREHLVSWRINWQPKSQNIRSLARELNLGLDSFIFLDDNPVECAEVRAACPEVLTLRLPIEGDIDAFLKHVWSFDRVRITSEDQKRTAMYKQEAERARLQQNAPTIHEFLAALDLRITISEPGLDQVARVAQLTQRTNQFNFTTARRNDGEIQRLRESQLECQVVEVSDRFGDYGLVGVMIFGTRGTTLEIDTLLLSCRVLGRGVEHHMLKELGEVARRRQLSLVAATLVPTKKNQPARDFLEAVAGDYRREIAGGWRYEIPIAAAEAIVYSPGTAERENTTEADLIDTATTVGTAGQDGKSERFERIAIDLGRPEQIFEALHARAGRRRLRPELNISLVAPRGDIEAALVEIWVELLQVEPVGIQDNYFELGGTSLLAVDLFAQIERRFDRKLPLTSLIEASTIEQLARLISGTADRDSLVLIREGEGRPPLFLVHDGDGETMLYRNLALHLKAEHAVYGLQPYSQPNVPMAHSRIAEMATYHIGKMRTIQPQGPYVVGGMCAGGVIAFEIAVQLQNQGEKVALVALIDAADAAARPKTWRLAKQRFRSFTSVIQQDRSARLNRRVLSVFTKASSKAKNLVTHLVEYRLAELHNELRMRLFRYRRDRGWSLPRLLERIPVRTVYLFAEKNYRPAGRFAGDLVLFRATQGEGPDEPYIERYEDPLLGWGPRTTRRVRAHDVPGGHASMLQEPNVRVLAEQLQLSIDEAIGNLTKPSHESIAMDATRQISQAISMLR